MQRIGTTASRIAQGNLFLYHAFVVLISFLISLLVFLISGLAITIGLVIISYLVRMPSIVDLSQGLISPLSTCLLFLAMVIVVFNLYAIGTNIKIKSE